MEKYLKLFKEESLFSLPLVKRSRKYRQSDTKSLKRALNLYLFGIERQCKLRNVQIENKFILLK